MKKQNKDSIATSKNIKPYTKVDKLFEELTLEQVKHDNDLMDQGECPSCHSKDTDEVREMLEFPHSGVFMFRCNSCGFTASS